MSREIKFRKWHVGLYDMTFWDGTKGSNNLFWHTITEYPEMYILMQFTGVLDRNSKEIYEGDILRVKSNSSTPIEIIHDGEKLTAYKPNYNIAVVVFYKSAFCLHSDITTSKHEMQSKHNGTTYYGTLQGINWDNEVIGNIYENPELLK